MRARPPAPLSRRRFLGALLALSVTGLLPRRALALLAPGATTAPTTPTAEVEPPPVGGLDGVDAVGSIYLHHHPEEAATGVLRASLGLAPDRDPERGMDRLRRRIQADFEIPDIVAIDGWRLSRTEARWAALLHLERQT